MENKITFTPEIKAKIPEYKERCTKDLYSGKEWDEFNPKISTEYIHKIYELSGKKDKPVVIYADSPPEYERLFRLMHKTEVMPIIYKVYEGLNGITNISDEEQNRLLESINEYKLNEEDLKLKPTSHYIYLCSIYHRIYLTWYQFIQDHFDLENENKEALDYLAERSNNSIARCYFTQMVVLVLRTPQWVKKNESGFHSIDGSAIEWPNYSLYYINGRNLSEELFIKTTNKSLTFDEFIKIDGEDTKSSIITLITMKFGKKELMDFLGAKIVDTKELNHSSGYNEVIKLWKTDKTFSFVNDLHGNLNQPYAWIEMKCPSSKSIYLIPTSAHFNSALEAMKFHRPKKVSIEIPYDWAEFNS